MTRGKWMLLVSLATTTAAVALAFGSVTAQEDDETVASLASVDCTTALESAAPLESTAPIECVAPGLSVHDAWARESMMEGLAGAAFMIIHNGSDSDDALVGASSPASASVEMHQTSMAADGTMAMAPVAEVPVPAYGDAVLEPGGYHVMLIDLAEPLVVGAEIELTLEFASGATQMVLVPVQAMGPMDMGTEDGLAGMHPEASHAHMDGMSEGSDDEDDDQDAAG